MRRILVLRGGALGDFIVTLPALAALRARWPAAHIELVGNATAAALALHRGVISAAASQHEARWSALFGDAPLPPALRDWLGAFDLVVNYWPDPDGELRRRFPLHPAQTFLSAPAMPDRAPAAAHYCTPLRALGIECTDLCFRLRPLTPFDEGASAAGVWVHPGSGSPRKNWPAENWRALIPTLPAPVTMVLGEAERDVWAVWPGPGVQALIARPLEELVQRLSRARLFIGHDSGISHLAAACGVPCVLLFGPTDPAVWAPPAPNVRVLRRGLELSSLSLSDVRRAVQEALGDRT